MPDWPIHIIVPLLALLIVGRKEDKKYILLLLPLAIIPDFDSFADQHRALLHNIFLPMLFLLLGLIVKQKKAIFVIAAVYLASHVFMDMFDGGVVLFYPFYNKMAFVDASLSLSTTNELKWVFDYGIKGYTNEWMIANGYISDSIGTAALIFILLAGVYTVYRNRKRQV